MKTALDPRHQKRQKVVQELFAFEEQRAVSVTDDKIADRDTWDDATRKIISHLTLIDSLIAKAAPEWELSKINRIDLAILRLATFELAIDPAEPAKVVIDEAVELAKEFGSETTPAFVNGALGKILFSRDRLLAVIAAKIGAESTSLSETDDLISDLNATPLEVDDLLITLERDLGITFPNHNQFKSVGDILTHIEDATD